MSNQRQRLQDYILEIARIVTVLKAKIELLENISEKKREPTGKKVISEYDLFFHLIYEALINDIIVEFSGLFNECEDKNLWDFLEQVEMHLSGKDILEKELTEEFLNEKKNGFKEKKPLIKRVKDQRDKRVHNDTNTFGKYDKLIKIAPLKFKDFQPLLYYCLNYVRDFMELFTGHPYYSMNKIDNELNDIFKKLSS